MENCKKGFFSVGKFSRMDILLTYMRECDLRPVVLNLIVLLSEFLDFGSYCAHKKIVKIETSRIKADLQ